MGGAIALGHPLGATGAIRSGHRGARAAAPQQEVRDGHDVRRHGSGRCGHLRTGLSMHAFDEAVALTSTGENRYSGATSAAYANMVGPFGGITAAAVMRSVLQHPKLLGEPVSLTVNYAAALADGAFHGHGAAGAHQPVHPALVDRDRSTRCELGRGHHGAGQPRPSPPHVARPGAWTTSPCPACRRLKACRARSCPRG